MTKNNICNDNSLRTVSITKNGPHTNLHEVTRHDVIVDLHHIQAGQLFFFSDPFKKNIYIYRRCWYRLVWTTHSIFKNYNVLFYFNIVISFRSYYTMRNMVKVLRIKLLRFVKINLIDCYFLLVLLYCERRFKICKTN